MERNKGWRQEKTSLKYKKRLKDFGIFNHGNPEKWTTCYKDTSTPCSCSSCSPGKIEVKKKDKIKHKKKFIEKEIEQDDDL